MKPFSIQWYLNLFYLNHMLMGHKIGWIRDQRIGAIDVGYQNIESMIMRRWKLSKYIITRIERKLEE